MSTEWRDHAACRGLDVNMFFPAVGDGTTVRQALAVCNGDLNSPVCPVRSQCADFVLSFEQDEDVAGIFGGMTSAERRKTRKQARIERMNEPAVTDERLFAGDSFSYQLGTLLNLIHSVVADRLE